MKKNILTPRYNQHGIFIRSIRSFVCRTGRITKFQLKSIEKYWPLIGVNFTLQKLNFASLFDCDAPIIVEIGFGSGESLVKNAINFPNKNFIGIEVYKSGIGSCLHAAFTSKIKNLRIIYHDATEVMHDMVKNQTLSQVQIFFPDPWEKKRHHKRRLLKRNFLKVISKKLISSGILHIATDSEEYALYILNEIKDIKKYINLSKNNDFITRPDNRIITKFEKRGSCQGNKIFDLMFQLKE